MAVSLWITTVATLTCIVSHFNSEAVTSYNRNNRDNQPQKMVEIIELMLSQKPNNSEKRDFGIQKVPQEEPAGYSIFITPNKNEQEPPGKQKIKIFVEADDYDDKGVDMLPQETKTFTFVEPKKNKQNIFEVLPLSIETAGMILDDYQKTHTPNTNKAQSEYDDNHQKNSGYPSKRQTNSGTTQKPKSNSRTTMKVHHQPTEDDRSTTTTRKETVRTTTTRSTSRLVPQDNSEENTRRTSTTFYSDKPKPNSYGLGSTLVLTVNEELPLSTSQVEPSYVDQTRPHLISSSNKNEETPRPLTYDNQFSKSSQTPQQGNANTGYSSPNVEYSYSKAVQVPDDYRRKPEAQYEQAYEERPVYNREPERPKETKRQPTYQRETEDVDEIKYDTEPDVRPTRDQRPSVYNEDDDHRGDRRPSYGQTTSHRPVRDNNYSGKLV